MNNKKEQDLKFGFSSEDTSKMYLERRFGVLDKTDKYNKFDFVNDKYKVELKTRKCKFGDYPDLQFEVGKIVEVKKDFIIGNTMKMNILKVKVVELIGVRVSGRYLPR